MSGLALCSSKCLQPLMSARSQMTVQMPTGALRTLTVQMPTRPRWNEVTPASANKDSTETVSPAIQVRGSAYKIFVLVEKHERNLPTG